MLKLAALLSLSIGSAFVLAPQTVEVIERIAIGRGEFRKPISHLPFVIDECGSYFLTKCLTGVSGQDGITIQSDNVTIDLNGFTLTGVPGAGSGILVSGQRKSVTVYNGTIDSWPGDGINAASAICGRFEDVQLTENGVVSGTGLGLRTGEASRVLACSSRDNGGGGYVIGGASVVRSCIAHNNTNASSSAHGFVLNGDCHVSDSTAEQNSDAGFLVDGPGNIVSNCTANINSGGGIVVLSRGNVIRDNVCQRNAPTSTGAGIHVLLGSHTNRIDSNHLDNNAFGIKVDHDENLIVRNSAHNNGTNYDVVAGNDVGPQGTAASSTSPWANVEY